MAVHRIATITAGATLLQAANGLLQAILPLRMDATGLSVAAIGSVATSYGLGFAAGCAFAPAFVRHVGHIRAFASLAAIVAVVVLAFTQAQSWVTWTALRAVSGLALAGLFTVADSWISARASLGNRGRVISIYMICTKIALMVSPLCIVFGEIRGDGLFMTVAALLCLSLLPLAATLSEEPTLPGDVRPEIGPLFGVAPSAVVGAFAVGLMNGPVIALAPVYGLAIGLSPDVAATLLFALQGGSLLLQWPLGWMSDQVDRRILIAALAAGTALISAMVAWSSTQGAPTIVVLGFALWGGLALCIYAICVAHASDLVEPARIVPTVSTLLLCWATGMMIGPLLAAGLMGRVGPHGLFIYSGAVGLSLAIFIALRILVRPRGPHRHNFVPLLPSSPVTGSLTRSSPRDPK